MDENKEGKRNNSCILISRMKKIMSVNHNSLTYKMQAQPNKTYKDLRQKQKTRISDWMFRAACEYYKEYGKMPGEEAAEPITARIYDKIKSVAIWVPYDEVCRAFRANLPRYETRISEHGLPEEKPPKPKAPPAPKKKGNSNKVYIIQLRLAYAKRLLGSATLPISTIAYKSVFNDVNNFTNLFKKGTGMTPGAYQKQILHQAQA